MAFHIFHFGIIIFIINTQICSLFRFRVAPGFYGGLRLKQKTKFAASFLAFCSKSEQNKASLSLFEAIALPFRWICGCEFTFTASIEQLIKDFRGRCGDASQKVREIIRLMSCEA